MAISIGKLALILSANSAGFAAGINSAKSSLTLFEQACKATFGAIQAAADRLTFKNMVGDIRAMTAAVNEMGKAQQSLQKNAAGAMKKWPAEAKTTSPEVAKMMQKSETERQRALDRKQAASFIGPMLPIPQFELGPDGKSKAQMRRERAKAAAMQAERLDKKLLASMKPADFAALDEPGLKKARREMAKQERLESLDETLRGRMGDEKFAALKKTEKAKLRAELNAASKAAGDAVFILPPKTKLSKDLAQTLMGVPSAEGVAQAEKAKMLSAAASERSAASRAADEESIRKSQLNAALARESGQRAARAKAAEGERFGPAGIGDVRFGRGEGRDIWKTRDRGSVMPPLAESQSEAMFHVQRESAKRRAAAQAKEAAQDARMLENAIAPPKQGFAELAVQGFVAYHAIRTLVGGLKSWISEWAQFEYQIKRLQVVTRASGSESKEAETQVRSLAMTGIGTHLDLAKAQTRLGLAGFTMPEAKAVMPTVSKLALMSGEDPAAVGDSFAVALRSMQIPATKKNAEYVGDVLALANTKSMGTMEDMLNSFKFAAPYAHAAAMDIKELAASLAVLSNAGLKGELGGTVMRGMLKKTANQSAEAHSQMKRLNISFQDAKGNFIGMGPAMKMLNEQTKDLGKLQQVSVFSEIFDARAATGVLRLTQGVKEYQHMMDELQAGAKGGLLGTQTDEMLGTMLMKINRMKAAWMEFKLGFSSTMAPLTTAFLDKMTKVLQGDVGAGAGLGLTTLAGGILGYRVGGARGALAGGALGGAAEAGGMSGVATGAMIGASIASFAAKGSMFGGLPGALAGAALGAAIGGLTAAIEKLSERENREDKEKVDAAKAAGEKLMGLGRAADLGTDFFMDKDEGWKRKHKGGSRSETYKIGGKWVDTSEWSDELKDELLTRRPGSSSISEQKELRDKLSASGLYGKATLFAQDALKKMEDDAWEKKHHPEKYKLRLEEEEDKRTLSASQMIAKAGFEWAEREKKLKGYEAAIDPKTLGTPNTGPFKDREEAVKKELDKLKAQGEKWGGIGDIFARAAVSSISPVIDALTGLARPNLLGGGLFNKAFPAAAGEATDQVELQKIFNRNEELNRTLIDQGQAARMAAQGHHELYEAHRAGLPWLDLEAAKVRLSSENMLKLGKLEIDEAKVRKELAKAPASAFVGARLDQILENRALLQESIRAQTEAAITGEKQKVWDDTRMPMEKHLGQVQKLDSLVLKAGLDWDTYARGIRKAGGDMDAVLGSSGAWKAGSALEAGSAQAISAMNQSRYGEEVSSGRQSEEHLRLMLIEIQKLNTTLDGMGGAAGLGAAIARAVAGGDGMFKGP